MPKTLKKSEQLSEATPDRPSRETLVAQVAIRPTFLAANTISAFNQVLGEIDLMGMAGELEEQVSLIKKGDMSRAENTLASQAIVLDTLFNTLAVKALKAPGLENQSVMLKLALQAQKQCSQTLEALGAIKNPPAVTVVRQTNIGQAVQVNHGTSDEITAINLENELLEQDNGQRLDTRAQNAPISADTNLATMERRHRAKDKNWKSQVGA
ncbi:MAG: hypothetical protein M0R47_19055 [Methylobacter sp.]|uniref:hypothetical protein n=1 Tax=Methylobacter sp. TaxID=2051955 RepID=UPI0025FA02BF|nr:hypothetical protein [Methylobacter sp.]MCK9622621.1 hypothetical protein [Methylobacter sp.]